jgi:hypothetical protein
LDPHDIKLVCSTGSHPNVSLYKNLDGSLTLRTVSLFTDRPALLIESGIPFLFDDKVVELIDSKHSLYSTIITSIDREEAVLIPLMYEGFSLMIPMQLITRGRVGTPFGEGQ